MNEDRQFARLLGMMREQGGKDNPTTIEIGEMASPTSCLLGGMELDGEDLLFNESLLKPRRIRYETTFRLKDGGTYQEYEGYDEKVEYASPLKKGDLVALMRLMGEDGEAQERYIVLCRVVEA